MELPKAYKASISFDTGNRSWLKALKHHSLDNAALILLSISSYILCFFASKLLQQPLAYGWTDYKSILLPGFLAATFIISLIGIIKFLLLNRPKHPIRALLQLAQNSLSKIDLYVRIFVLFFVVSLGFLAFNEFKLMIPNLIPFYLDDKLIEIDRFLHLGRLPWEYGWSFTSQPHILKFLDFVYSQWFGWVIGIWAFAAISNGSKGWERQYVLSFLLLWLIGGALMAVLMSSAGPCFYDRLELGVSPYQAQMDYLRNFTTADQAIMAPIYQDLLWQSYIGTSGEIKSGISAMPSLHNAMSALFVIWGFKMNRWIGWLMTLNMLLIFAGSVVLGWHYAVDAYVGWALTVMLWLLAGYIIKFQDRLLVDIRDRHKV